MLVIKGQAYTSINVKGINITISFDSELIESEDHTFVPMRNIQDWQLQLIRYYTRTELRKYPKGVITDYFSGKFYIVDKITVSNGDEILGLLTVDDDVVLSYSAIKEGLNTIHHEIFHLFLRHKPELQKLFIKDLHSRYEYDPNSIVTSNALYHAGFCSGYFPNPEEDLCEIFACLMLKKPDDYRDYSLIEWFLTKQTKGNSKFLLVKIALVMLFTEKQISSIMNPEYYTTIN